MTYLLQKIQDFVEKHSLLDLSIGVGFSGGADSTSLLYLLHSLKLPVTALYVNHNLRPSDECRKEAGWISDFCQELKVPLIIETCEIGAIKKAAMNRHISIEESARLHRYNFFDRCLDKDVDCVFLAHHQDDWIENQVIRFCMGAGLKGLTGMEEKRGLYYRPFLNFSRQDLLDFLNHKDIDWFEDSTNSSDDYQRNQVRHHIIPKLQEIFPNLFHSLGSGARSYQEAVDALFIPNGFRPFEKGFRCQRSFFWNVPAYLRKQMIYDLFDQEFFGTKNVLPRRFLSALENVELAQKEGILLQGYGFILYNKGDDVFWKRNVVHPEKNGYLIQVSLNTWISLNDEILKISPDLFSEYSFHAASGELFLIDCDLHQKINYNGEVQYIKDVLKSSGWFYAPIVCIYDQFGPAAVLNIGSRKLICRDSQSEDKNYYITWKEVN